MVLSDENSRNEAFEYFFTLRNEKTLAVIFRKISERFHVADRTVRTWYHQYNWKEMADKKHDKMMVTIEGAVTTLIEEEIEVMRRVYITAIEDFKERVDKGQVKIANFKDFNDCVKAYATLTNVSSNPKNNKGVVVNVITGIPRPTGISDEDNRPIIEVHTNGETSAGS